jgi:hypothetical protein
MSKPLQLNTKHGSGRPTVARSHAIPDRVDFRAGNLHGANEAYGPFSLGQLPGWASNLLSEHYSDDKRMYVVYSYVTPIAWWTETHGWVVPNTKYSVTTTGHQTSVLVALIGVEIEQPTS